MAVRLSTYARNFLLNFGSLKQLLSGGEVRIFTGSQPASADDAETGTELVTLTSSSGSRTAETRATGTITLTGSSGTCTGVTFDGIEILGATVTYATSLTVTAALIAEQINKFNRNLGIEATSSGAVVTVYAPRGSGDTWNGVVLNSTMSGGDLAGADVNIGSAASGVDFANGLLFNAASSGSIAKDSSQTWSGVASDSGVAGWFRFCGSVTDPGTADSSYVYARIDGNIATSGANLNLTSTNITATATQTVSSWTWTMPASA
jgi:hypothetical protein